MGLPVPSCSSTARTRTISIQLFVAFPCPNIANEHTDPLLASSAKTLHVDGKSIDTDSWTNVTPSILDHVPRRLHLQPSHPISLTRELITSRFAAPTYRHYDNLSPAVTVGQNFDSLGFPPNHPGRAASDTYYLNASTVLRTHSSAHQVDTFRADESDGWTLCGDVYRRDAVDRSHYPVFHQLEGARTWDRGRVPGGDVADAVWKDLTQLPRHELYVEDPSPTVHPERNPLQEGHSLAEVEAVAAHLKRSLEDVVAEVMRAARLAAGAERMAEGQHHHDLHHPPPRVRWVEAYFPFTSPSWELEVLWQGDWLELLGCGVVQQPLLDAAGQPGRVGWAFGLGVERIAMLLYGIPDIRLFWSRDSRFLGQFEAGKSPRRFVPFSKYPPSQRDVAFWLKSSSSSAGGGSAANSRDFHENDVMEIVRDVCGQTAEDVRLVDEFVHPSTGRKSLCYRIVYRSLERTMTTEEINQMHDRVRDALSSKLGVEMR